MEEEKVREVVHSAMQEVAVLVTKEKLIERAQFFSRDGKTIDDTGRMMFVLAQAAYESSEVLIRALAKLL